MILRFLPPLLVLFLAPACAPPEPPPPAVKRGVPTVLLSDTTVWDRTVLRAYRDSLEATGDRLVVSGYAGETASELMARLPWLLQPGTERIVYDARLAGPAALDSLQRWLSTTAANVELLALPLPK